MKRSFLIVTSLALLLVFSLLTGWYLHASRREQVDQELIAAIKADHTQQALAALAAGANPNVRDIETESTTGSLQFSRLLEKLFHRTDATDGNPHERALTLVLDRDPDKDKMPEQKTEDTTLVKALLDAGADPNTPNEKDGFPPLLLAVQNWRPRAVRMILEHGGKIEQKDREGGTPLSWAAGSANSEALRILLKAGADINAKDRRGSTPLHVACADGNLATVEILLQNNAPVNVRDNDGHTPLDAAIEEGRALAEGIHSSDWKGERRPQVLKRMREAGGKTSHELDKKPDNR